MIVIITIIYYVFLRYAPEQIITYSGYAIEGQALAKNLKNSDISNVKPYLDLVEVQENDLLYKRLNSYYVGEDDKKEIDINYPIYINEGNALFNISTNTKLITVNYEEVAGYPEFMMTDGVMYNGADLTRADGNKYIFLKSEDEIFTNVGAIKITTATNTYNIKEFSNIYFTENSITYYEMEENSNVQNWYMQYKRIDDIDNNSKIEINGETISYKTFLERLGLIDSEENINNADKEKTTNEINENTGEEPEQVNNENTTSTTDTTDKVEENDENNKEDEWQEEMWEKPEVSCTDFEGEVYTIKTNLSVRDRAGVITRGITFEIYLDGRLNRRVQASQAGTLEITNLQPSSEYEIRGIFYYNDENGVEQEEEFYTGKVSTKSIDTLGTLDFSFQNGKIYSNKIELIHLKLNNNIDEEVVRGISRVQVEIGDVAYRLTNAQIDELKAGKEITYQTSENLTSNSKIKYEITAFDRYGNELKEKNNTGETITSKQAPSSSIRVTKQDVTEVDLEVILTNKDNVSLENYRYEITNQSGDVVKQGILDKNKDKETLVFTDLDPNGYYQIVIYGDYDLENGEGEHQNSELGRGSFVTRPIASLGYMQVKIDDKEVTQEEMKLGISIDENQTDARLLAILNKVEVVIYDEGKNIDDNVSDDSSGESGQQEVGQSEEQTQETEIRRITLTDEEVEKLKTAEEIELNLEKLTSNTKYRIDVITTVKQGSVEEVVEDKQNIDQIITLKMPAEVQIRNQFVIGTMIDLDMRIEDIDGADLVDKVRIEVRDKDNKLVNLSEMPTNAEWERKTYEGLTPNETYTILVYAPQYNEGSTDATYKADYLLKEIKILTETGISGKLDLIGLEKTPSGKNLIDVSSKVNWYEKCFNSAQQYGISYNSNTKILTLGGTVGYTKRTYYDLCKYLGQEVTISFNARTEDNADIQIIEKNNMDFNDTNYTSYYSINDLTNEWKECNYTVKLNKTGYIGFRIVKDNTSVEIQNLQIELGNKKTDYEEFKYDYNANVAVSVFDARNEITTNDYYIRIYKNNKQIQELRYEEIGEENKVENLLKTYNIEPDATYRIELLVKIADRYYELDSQEFSTEGSKELKGLSDVNDFLKIQPEGEYIVLGDLDFSGDNEGTLKFGDDKNLFFDGRIDFNGKAVTKDWKTGKKEIFGKLGKNGIFENIVFNIDMNYNDPWASDTCAGLLSTNDGVIRNIQINLLDSNYNLNTTTWLFCYRNNGVIENFVINFESPFYLYGMGAIFGWQNYGTIRNGYIYGENIKMLNTSSNIQSAAEIVSQNCSNGVIENIFTLVGFDKVSENAAGVGGVLLYTTVNSAIVQNVYSVDVGKGMNLAYGPNVYSKGSKKIYNNYYFDDEIFTSELETKGNKLSLWDAEFQNQLLNNDGAFKVDELVNEGYYPQLNMPDIMPAQDFIELPAVKDSDLPDILSAKVIEQGTDTVKVQFSINNPSAEQISEIRIENIETVDILSQEYKDGKSTVIAELRNPIICISEYDVISLTVKGAFGGGYTRPYEEGERVINVDLYKEIWNVNDWKNIKDSPTENYMLMTDLDFINEGNTVRLGNVIGIINGNGHTMSNLNLTNNPLIMNLHGKLENLYINNFNQEQTSYGGMIDHAQTGSVINNVHMKNVTVIKKDNGGFGPLVSIVSSGSVIGCSASGVSLIVDKESANEIYAGGLIGKCENSSVETCYVYGLSIKDQKAISSGIGGVVGIGNGTNKIVNCYSEGRIDSSNLNVGGIVGSIGTANIENCYSKVNISTTNNNVGGIIGLYSGTDISTISNNLSIGNIYTTSGVDSLNRIVGSNENTSENNYAYENQLLNGYKNAEEKGALLLSNVEVLNLNLGESYNYDSKEKGILPKLLNTEGTELLPNQEDIFLNDAFDSEKVELEIEKIEASKPNTTEAEITVRINNPEEVEIIGIEIEDMTISSITRNVMQNGITSITVTSTPNRYYDSYKLTGIKYKDKSGEEQVKEVENEVEVQFYKEIYTFEDWQTIEEETYQNYRLMADIDFSGRSNIKNNISVNRLEAENGIYTLKNINLTFNSANSGLINNVKTSMKNIGFENITLTNSSGSGDYFGVIASSNGKIENLRFKNVTVDAKGLDYVGMIGGVTSGNISNIKMEEKISILGNSYVGGLVGQVDIVVGGKIEGVSENDLTINGKGNYVGGVIGWQSGNDVVLRDISVNNSNITGKDYTAGVLGYGSNGDFTYIETNGSNVIGNGYVGGIFGDVSSRENTQNRQNIQVTASRINGNASGVGGIVGRIQGGWNRYWNVYDVTINVLTNNVEQIGGLAGCLHQSQIARFQVNELTLNTYANRVAGATGKMDGRSSLVEGSILNSVIQGNSQVSGLIGYVNNTSTIYDVLINGNVKAINSLAGGIFGYMDNSSMNSTSSIIQITRTMIVDSSISAPIKAGGLIGDITKEIYRDQSFYYNNYIDADVTSENTSTSSLIIGGRPDENSYITNTYVYKYSALNGDYVYASNDNIDNSQYLVRTDLDKVETLRDKVGLGTNAWNYASLTEGKYPKIKDDYLYKPELQEGIDLPTDPDITIINSLNSIAGNGLDNENDIAVQSIETLPTVTAYPVSVNEINIDFSTVPEKTRFTYYVNGQEKDTVELSKKTYTFRYNYQDTIEIKLTNEENKTTSDENGNTITITPDNVRSEASLVGNNNAYLLGTSLYINGELQQGNYVNVYGGYALNSSGQVVDIATKQIVTNADSNSDEEAVTTLLEQTTKPLHTYDYKGNTIETYGTYSKVNDNIKTQIYNVRSGMLSAISNNTDMKIDNSITDNYNNKEYQTILNRSGELIDLKEKLQYPSNFLSSNIKQIVQNQDTEKPEMMVLYNTGKVIVFNYVNGNIVYENNEKADSSLVNYLTRSFANIWNDYEDKYQDYEKSKELETKLAKLPVEEAIKEATNNGLNNNIENTSNDVNNNNINANNSSVNTNVEDENNSSANTTTNSNTANTIDSEEYITVYNENTGEYEVYSEEEILNGEEENPVSETEKIKENGLEGVYGYNTQEETKPQANGAIIVVSIIAVAIIALVILRKVIAKNNNKKDSKNKN